MATSESERELLERLNDYWDEVVRGGSPDPTGVDPEFAAIIQRLHAADAAGQPDPAFAVHLRRSLLAGGNPTAAGGPQLVADDEAAGRQSPSARPQARRNGRHPLVRLALLAGRAAAVLIILAALSALLAAAWTLGRPLLEGRVGPNVAADPRDALVELHFATGDGRHLQAGVSLGNGRIVTAATWSGDPAFAKIEANWGKHVNAAAEIVKVDRERGLALLQIRGAMPPALGAVGQLSNGEQVRLLGHEGPDALPPAEGTPSVTSVLSLREAAGEVVATGVALPDPRAAAPPATPQAGPYAEVRGEAWPGLLGGLVLDAESRPAGLVALVQMLTSGAPGTAYALPLDEVREWADMPDAVPTTPVPAVAQIRLGKLAFVRDGDIWVKELPDGAEHRLTEDGKNAEPRWSPSGKWLTFTKEGAGLWLLGVDGGEARQLGMGPQAAWSPVDDRLAYSHDGFIFLEDVSTQDALRLPVSSAGQFVWSADGQWLAYTVEEMVSAPEQGQQPLRRAAIYKVRSDGRSAPLLVLDGGSPSAGGYVPAGLTADGAVLYWDRPAFSNSILADGVPLNIARSGGGAPATLVPAMPAQSDFWDASPVGGDLVLTSGGDRQTWTNKRIVRVDLASMATTDLTEAGTAAFSPVFSPDGQRIAYVAAPDVGPVGGGEAAKDGMAKRRIWVMNRDGSDKQQLTGDAAYRDERPRWSADGSHILFGRLKDDQRQLWLMAADGSGLRQVVERIGPAADPNRQPPLWFGYYGHLDWDREYDWWRPPTPTMPKPSSTPSPKPTPSIGPMPTALSQPATKQLDDSEYMVSLQYPGTWQSGSASSTSSASSPRRGPFADRQVVCGVLTAWTAAGCWLCLPSAAAAAQEQVSAEPDQQQRPEVVQHGRGGG